MSQSHDPGHFFQTTTSLATLARRAAKATNKSGNPIPATSKILALHPDPRDPDAVYIAESCGIVRRVQLSTANPKSRLFRGFTAPTTCLALDAAGEVLFAGCWDQRILAWSTRTGKVLRVFEGHADFVKTLLWVGLPGGGAWLLSGSADKSIVVWNAETGEKLATLKGHTRAVGTLAVDPVLSDDVNAVLFSGGSEREVRRWTVPWAGPAAAVEAADTLGIHDTSVYKIAFLGEDADFWSSSADGTARRVDVRGTGEADTVLKHGDYVNDVVMAGEGRWVCTACRDEDVRVWDVASGELWHTFEGHADEVSALAVVGEKQDLLVSVSIDCTVRTWSLKPADLEAARVEAARIREGGVVEVKEEVKDDGVKLSAEEEAELAELMDDSD